MNAFGLRRMLCASAALLAVSLSSGNVARAELLAVGIDTKFWFDEDGHRVFRPNAGDLVQFYDLADPAHPVLAGSLPLTNSVVGPPTNIALTPDDRLALVASSIVTEATTDGKWKPVADNRVFVVDTMARPPRLIDTLTVGAQPSGIAINHDGTLALVANRVSKSITVLSIQGSKVSVTDTVPMGDIVTSVAFTPDGRRALVSKFTTHRVAVLAVDGGTVRQTGREMLVGQFPYTVSITADGRFGLAGSDAEEAASHGDTNPVAVIDMAAEPPRTVDFLGVGDGVEGIAVSPSGDYAVASILQGSLDAPRGAWYAHPVGRVVLLKTTNGVVSRGDSVDVGAFPEGVAFSRDGNWIYTGNFGSSTIAVLHREGEHLVNTNATVALPGPAASLRIGSE